MYSQRTSNLAGHCLWMCVWLVMSPAMAHCEYQTSIHNSNSLNPLCLPKTLALYTSHNPILFYYTWALRPIRILFLHEGTNLALYSYHFLSFNIIFISHWLACFIFRHWTISTMLSPTAVQSSRTNTHLCFLWMALKVICMAFVPCVDDQGIIKPSPLVYFPAAINVNDC